MPAISQPIFSQAAAARNHCPFPFSAIKFYIRMIACLLDLRTLFLGRVTFHPPSLASCIIHPDPGKHALQLTPPPPPLAQSTTATADQFAYIATTTHVSPSTSSQSISCLAECSMRRTD